MQAFHDAETMPRIVTILELGMRPGTSLYADLTADGVNSFSVESVRPRAGHPARRLTL